MPASTACGVCRAADRIAFTVCELDAPGGTALKPLTEPFEALGPTRT